MIHPSYNELIEAINENNEENDNAMLINSRYSLVLATSKRARQLIAGKEPLVSDAANKKPLSIAIEELYKGKVKILEDNEPDDELEQHYTSGALAADAFGSTDGEDGEEIDEDVEYDEDDEELDEEEENEEDE